MEFTKQDTKIIKGIAICFMLWHHLFGAPMRIPIDSFTSLFTLNGNSVATVISMFCKICVSLFTFMSGYGLYKSSLKGKYSSKYIWRHLISLYKYVWVLLLVTLPFSIYSHIDYGVEILYETIYNFIGIKATVNREWWFIAPYTMLLVLFPFIKKLVERSSDNFFLDFFNIVLVSSFCNYILPSITELAIMRELCSTILWGNFELLFDILPSFLLGIIIAKHNVLTEIKARYSAQSIYCIFSLITLLIVFILRFRNASYDYIFAAVIVICITILIPTKPMQLISRVLIPLGENSTAMWLIHSFYCYYIYPPIVYFLKYPVFIFIWLVVLSYISALGINVLLKKIEQFLRSRVKHTH